MLGSENFRGSHERHLIAVLDGDRCGFERDDCLAASHVAFEQTVHRIWLLEIVRDFREDALLRSRRLEGENTFQSRPDFIFANAHRDSAAAGGPADAAMQARADNKKTPRRSDACARGC